MKDGNTRQLDGAIPVVVPQYKPNLTCPQFLEPHAYIHMLSTTGVSVVTSTAVGDSCNDGELVLLIGAANWSTVRLIVVSRLKKSFIVHYLIYDFLFF